MIFRAAIFISCISFFLVAVQLMRAFNEMHEPLQPVLALLLCVEGFLLLRKKRSPIVIAITVWTLLVVLSVGGALLNPFFWDDMNFKINSENWIVPTVFLAIAASGIFCIWGLRLGPQPAPVRDERSDTV